MKIEVGTDDAFGVKGLTFKVPAFEALNTSMKLQTVNAYVVLDMEFKEVDLEE